MAHRPSIPCVAHGGQPSYVQHYIIPINLVLGLIFFLKVFLIFDIPSKKGVFHQRSSSIKGCLPSKIVHHNHTLPAYSLVLSDVVKLCCTMSGDVSRRLWSQLEQRGRQANALTKNWKRTRHYFLWNFLKKFYFYKNVRHSAKFQYFELEVFFCKHPYFNSSHWFNNENIGL